MTNQTTNGVGGTPHHVPTPATSAMTPQEQDVVRHLTAAWNAFMQLPTERLEYVLDFRTGMQNLRDQIAAREGNRESLISIPTNPLVVREEAPKPQKPLDLRTPVQKIMDRKAKQNARHKERRLEERAKDPEKFRAKERVKWQRRKARMEATLAAAGLSAPSKTSVRTHEPITLKAKRSKTFATDGISPPSGLSPSARVKWRYNNDPAYREHIKVRNAAWRRQKGDISRTPTSREPSAKERKGDGSSDRGSRRANDSSDGERGRATIKNALNSEARIRQLRSDPIFAAADAALPANMANHHRDDIRSELIMAVLEQRLTIDGIPKAAKSYITAHHRVMETYRTVSLDKPIGDGKGTLHDLVTEGMWA